MLFPPNNETDENDFLQKTIEIVQNIEELTHSIKQWHCFRICSYRNCELSTHFILGDTMIPAVNSALTGLQAFSTKMNSNANNIANASSEGYKKSRVTLANQAPQGVKATVETIDSPGTMVLAETNNGSEFVELSNVDLGQELPESQLNTRFYQANLKTLTAVDEMTNSLLNIKA